MADLKATPRSSVLGAIADALTRARSVGDSAKIPFTDMGLGELFLGKMPEEVNEWSYGNAPLQVVGRGTGSRVPQIKQGRREQLVDTVFGLQGMAPLAAASTRAVKAIPSAVRHGAQEFAHASAAANPRIIKDKGGNWLTGSVENELKRLKKPSLGGYANRYPNQPVPEAVVQEFLPNTALNNWIEGPLTKYVKRDMATESDPVRKLAEQGVLHINPDAITRNVDSATYANRGAAGFSPWGVAESDLAKSWENLSDRSVASELAGRMSESAKAQNPWLEKLATEERVYQPSKIGHEGLGFNHLTDELYNALNPESGLPRNLQLTPEQMQQIGMEKAVRHVDAINKWRAAQQAEANLAKSQSPAVHMVREYTENNPKGLRWVELKHRLAGEAEDAEYANLLASKESELSRSLNTEEKRLLANEFSGLVEQGRVELADVLKYEGDTMGHCVGGYCPDVLEGRSRIFSLRDAKGEPHVTIETRPGEVESIVQIKGKQNLKPKDEYLPFVQDFVRNHPEGGKWGDVGDFRNTGLERLLDYQENVQRAAREKYPKMEYLTAEELQPFIDAQFQPKQNFAKGGLVEADDDDFVYPGMF